jgi:hypothetical protein
MLHRCRCSTSKSTSKTTNTTSNIVSEQHRSDDAPNAKQPARDENDALHRRIAAIESENEARFAAIESKINHQSATTSTEMRLLFELIANLTVQVTALVAQGRPALTTLNETTDDTVRPPPSKRGPESSPSPNGATKHPPKRKSRPAPIQLDGDFANNEVATEEDGESQSMDGMELAHTQSRSSSPILEAEVVWKDLRPGNVPQPGSQES